MRETIRHIIFATLLFISFSCGGNAAGPGDIDPCAFCPFDFLLIDYAPDWSPDGGWIIYAYSSTENGRLWLMRPDGTQKRRLARFNPEKLTMKKST